VSPFLLLSHATARSPLDLKMRVPSHPYERGTYSPTGHKAKSDKEGRKRPREKEKKIKREEKEKRVESQDMDDRGDTRLFHKVDQRVLAIVNHHFQSPALVYNIYIYCWHSYSSAHTSLSRGLRNTIFFLPFLLLLLCGCHCPLLLSSSLTVFFSYAQRIRL
jgi:hypothetical protein